MITTPTVVLKCTCESEFQDKEYGKGMRLHNVCQKGTGQYRLAYCTVCCPRQPKPNSSDPSRKGKAV